MSKPNQQNAEFETWWAAPGPEFADERDIAWQAWQAAIAKEREACAEVCDALAIRHFKFPSDCAEAIRARGQEAA